MSFICIHICLFCEQIFVKTNVTNNMRLEKRLCTTGIYKQIASATCGFPADMIDNAKLWVVYFSRQVNESFRQVK